jgi:hypothetical protein
VSVEVYLEGEGYVALFGRVGKVPQSAALPEAYWVKVADTGYWELGTAQAPLASGRVGFGARLWRRLKLEFRQNTIRVGFDGAWLATVTDSSYGAGMVGLGSGWHGARFDNLTVQPLAALAEPRVER